MSNAKANILRRLQAANTTPHPNAHLPFHPWGWEGASQEEKLDRFVAGLTASHAEVITLRNAELSDTLIGLARDKGWQHAVIGTQGEHTEQFDTALSGIRLTAFDQNIEQWKSELFTQVQVGITHALAGIADTGTLVLWPDVNEPRSLSLIPPCHVAVIHRSQIMSHFLEVMERQQWADTIPTNALLISGPSKTADIQQTLAYGAHGPSELIVLVLNDM